MFTLTTDSSCDLLKGELAKLDIPYIPLTFIIDGVAYEDHFKTNQEYVDFYLKLKDGAMPTTSQITTFSFEEFFEKILKTKPDQDIIHLCLSSGVSGTYNNALAAAKAVCDKNKKVKILIVDTLAASQGLRLVLERGLELRDSNTETVKAFEKMKEISQNLHHWVVAENLMHLKRGGRMSAVMATVGSILKVKPILVCNHEGNLIVYKKVIGSAKAVSALITGIQENAADLEHLKVYIANTDNDEMVERVRQAVYNSFPNSEVVVGWIGPVIGSHLGNHCVAIMFEAKGRYRIT